ncbi:response regulator [Marinimicrobium agarilyticum]|uniref:response regulator n=1 Tax=Marinimicrobium agarilyticum TaxID=306546 RepID=UPI0003F6F12D|nr:response regulator transcription factor [Marinimicrobium agarilyticum]
MKPTILVIDDEPQIRRFMRISLGAEGFSYLEAENAARGLELASSHRPDLIILDLGLPDQDGFTTLQALRQWSRVPVLVLTARDAEEEKVKLLEGGANDYLSKPFGIKELIARVRVLLRDLPGQPPSTGTGTLDFGALVIDPDNHNVYFSGEPLTLARKEFAVLYYLASNHGRLVSHESVLTAVWGETHNEDTHYLRIIVSQLRKKLSDNPDAPEFIKTEPGIGYRFILCPEPSISSDSANPGPD